MKKKDLVIILIPTLIFVIAWIISSIYDSAVTSTITQQNITQIAPINPTFNSKVIIDLKKREVIQPVYKTDITPTPSPKTTNAKTDTSKEQVATTGGKLTK